MWRRLAAAATNIHLRTLAPIRSTAPKPTSAAPETLRSSFALFARSLNTASGSVAKRPEDVIPIVTGHEREELAAELKGEDILEINYPVGPFGTKEEPAVIKSYYDKRIIGCPGADGEDEHDVVWFWLEKGKPHECPVCSQYFVLEVVGPGGPPDGHGDDEDSHGHGHGY